MSTGYRPHWTQCLSTAEAAEHLCPGGDRALEAQLWAYHAESQSARVTDTLHRYWGRLTESQRDALAAAYDREAQFLG